MTGRTPATYEVRDDPDDLPFTFDTYAAAERFARKRAARLGASVLVYEVTENGERYLGAA